MEKRRKNRRKKENRNLIIISVLIVALVTGVAGFFVWYSKPMISEEELEGLWICDSTTSYEFEKEGNGTLYADDREFLFTYKIRRNNVIIDFKDDILRDCAYSISIEGNMLYMQGKKGTDGGQYQLEKLVYK